MGFNFGKVIVYMLFFRRLLPHFKRSVHTLRAFLLSNVKTSLFLMEKVSHFLTGSVCLFPLMQDGVVGSIEDGKRPFRRHFVKRRFENATI